MRLSEGVSGTMVQLDMHEVGECVMLCPAVVWV
jgi:hypothetical protein